MTIFPVFNTANEAACPGDEEHIAAEFTEFGDNERLLRCALA